MSLKSLTLNQLKYRNETTDYINPSEDLQRDFRNWSGQDLSDKEVRRLERKLEHLEYPIKKDHRYEGFVQWETMSMAARNLEKYLLDYDKKVDINYRVQAERILADPASRKILVKMAENDEKTIHEFAISSGIDMPEFRPKKDPWYKFWAQAEDAV